MADPEQQNVFSRHDHRRCRVSALREAASSCRTRGLRLTAVRERVLEILLESHRALGAYEILDRLKSEGFGGQPPIVYRALDFLVENGFVHRLERLNAFAACNHSGTGHEPMFLICQDCRRVAEAPLERLRARIDRTAEAVGFSVHSRVLEIVGQCPDCQRGPSE